MKEPESAIDVKMYEFGRLLDEVLDAAYDCEAIGPHKARARYKEVREKLMGAIRAAVAPAVTSQDRGSL